MEILILIIVFGLAIMPVALFRFFRRKKNTKTKEERREQTITAIIILVILFFIVFIRQTVLNDRKEDIIQGDSTSQSAQ